MDDQPAFGVDFSDWFLRWLNLVGECEQARGRMIDYDIKVVVMLGRSPMELRDHLRAYSALMPLAKSFFLQQPPMGIAAVSTAAGDSDAAVSALGWYGSWHEKGHGRGKNGEKGNGKGTGKGAGKNGERQGQEQQRERKRRLVE